MYPFVQITAKFDSSEIFTKNYTVSDGAKYMLGHLALEYFYNASFIKLTINKRLHTSEAGIGRCSVKKVSRKFRKIHRKHLCQCLFFYKVAGLRLQKRDSSTNVSCEFCEISKITIFYRIPPVATSDTYIHCKSTRKKYKLMHKSNTIFSRKYLLYPFIKSSSLIQYFMFNSF